MSRSYVCALAIVLAADPSGAQDVESWALAEDIRIGSIDRPNYAFGLISDIETVPDGRILVAQPRDDHIRVFHEDGRYLYTIGSAGDGPGELRGVGPLRYSGGRLSVLDRTRQRLHEFLLDGTYLKQWAPPAHKLSDGLTARVPHVRLADGSLIVVPSYRIGWDQKSRAIPILQFDTTGALLRTLARITVGDEGRRTRVGDLGAVIPQPVSSHSLWTTTHDGHALLVVHRAFGDAESPGAFRLLRIEMSGDTTLTRAYRVPVSRINTSGVADSIESIAERTSRLRPFPREQIAELWREGWDLPEYQAPIERIIAGMDGTIWVQRGAFLEPEAVWTILDHRGDILATLRTPAELRLMRVGHSHVWGVRSGEFGEPYVVRFRIVRQGGPRP